MCIFEGEHYFAYHTLKGNKVHSSMWVHICLQKKKKIEGWGRVSTHVLVRAQNTPEGDVGNWSEGQSDRFWEG